MEKDIRLLFESLLNDVEIKKRDFKGSQYNLDNDILKSQFVKDILCMANASGGDGYIVLGVIAEGEKRTIVGISHHYDSASLEELVASVIEEPIHFEYLPVEYKGKSCAILHIPPSSARPHWPKKDFGKLRKYVFYTRRSSGNREASFSEIREMFLSSVRVVDVKRDRQRISSHIVDELAEVDVEQRTQLMYEMLRNVAPKIPLKNYLLVSRDRYGWIVPKTFALLTSTGVGNTNEYSIFMYPISARKDDILYARSSVNRVLDTHSYYISNKDKPKKSGMIVNGIVSYSYDKAKYQLGKRLHSIGSRLEGCTMVHISYQNIYTRFTGLQWGGLTLQNDWSESWGKVIKWKLFRGDKTIHELFLSSVTSKAELLERLTKLTSWLDAH